MFATLRVSTKWPMWCKGKSNKGNFNLSIFPTLWGEHRQEQQDGGQKVEHCAFSEIVTLSEFWLSCNRISKWTQEATKGALSTRLWKILSKSWLSSSSLKLILLPLQCHLEHVWDYFNICEASKLGCEQLTDWRTKCSSEGEANFILSQQCTLTTEKYKEEIQR